MEARNALKVKKSNASMGEYAQTGFPAFEEYVNSYLGGGNGTNVGGLNRSGEALRLKLATPLNVSELLLSASKQILDAEMSVADTSRRCIRGGRTNEHLQRNHGKGCERTGQLCARQRKWRG